MEQMVCDTGIMSIAPKGQDIRFSEERIEQGRNFCNKLWNLSRFRQMADEETRESTLEEIISRINPAQLNQDDHAILLRLVQTLDEVDRLYEEYEFNSVLQSIYRFFWNDLCDWYVENSKARMKGGEDKNTCLAIQDLCLRTSPAAAASCDSFYYRRAVERAWVFRRAVHPVDQSGNGSGVRSIS
jgi:valyl-tRNA synthetase